MHYKPMLLKLFFSCSLLLVELVTQITQEYNRCMILTNSVSSVQPIIGRALRIVSPMRISLPASKSVKRADVAR